MQIPKRKKLYTTIFWVILALPVLIVFSVFLLIITGNFGFMPTFEELENPKSNLASEIYSSDQIILGKYYLQNRSIVNFNQLSPYLVKALVATEDARFYEHSGIDFRGLGRVLFKTVILGQHKGGGSTITQQLAKNLFDRNLKENIVVIKFKEWITAIRLERNYTKDEIIAMYFNTVPFGSGAFGIKAACRTFFDTTPDSLKIEEAALLVGMANGPTRYSPLPPRHPKDSLRIRRLKRTLIRRNLVLAQMEKYKVLPRFSHEKYDSIRALSIKIHYKSQRHDKGIATYFRMYLRKLLTAQEPDSTRYRKPYDYRIDSTEWVENPLYGWVAKNPKPDGSYYNIYKDGLKIYTTIDSRMQEYAESAVTTHLGTGKDPLQKVFNREIRWRKHKPFSNDLSEEQYKRIMNMYVRTSERYRVYKIAKIPEKEIVKLFHTPVEMTVFSWHGDIDTTMTPWDSILYTKSYLRAGLMSMEPSTGYVKAYVGGLNYSHFKYDQVTQGRRQVGSTFKPFLYTLAMIDGYSPCYKVANIPWYFDKENEKPKYSKTKHAGEMVTLKYGLANSLNQISAWLINKYKPEPVVKLAKSMGIKSYIPAVPSICVGSPEIKLGEMVSAYCTFDNKGVYNSPVYVTRIEDRNGNVLAKFSSRKKAVISENTAYLMINLMQGVVDMGTSVRLRFKYGFKNPIAGKTGTTNNNSDGWFMGMVPNLVTGIWVGGDIRSIHFRSTALGQGANMALPIWALYMKAIYKDPGLTVSSGNFLRPINLKVETDCNKYNQRDSASADNTYNSILEDEDY